MSRQQNSARGYVRRYQKGDAETLPSEAPSYRELCCARHLSQRMLQSNNWMQKRFTTAGTDGDLDQTWSGRTVVLLNTDKR